MLTMEKSDFLDLLLNIETPPAAIDEALAQPIADNMAQQLVDSLKQAADDHWYKDPNHSLCFAERIIQLGQKRNNAKHTALGMMAKGDALKLLSRIKEAWDLLDDAGAMFRSVDDEFGWARTRIGRLYISIELNQVQTAQADADRAHAIFAAQDDKNMMMRLEVNRAVVYDATGDHHQALHHYEQALASAQAMREAGEPYLSIIYTNMGYAYNFLGDFRQAQAHYEAAKANMLAREETSGLASVELSIAHIELAQGHYRSALHLLHDVAIQTKDSLPKESMLARREMVECYLLLNHSQDAVELAKEVLSDYQEAGADSEVARTYLLLAEGEAQLQHFDEALTALQQAESIYQSLNALPWIATIKLRRGRIALQQGQTDLAQQEAQEVQKMLETQPRPMVQGEAILLNGQAAYQSGDLASAQQAGEQALSIAQSHHIPAIRYGAHLLLGRVAEQQGHTRRALRRYRAAVATIDRLQRNLTITLRPGFLEDKGDALRALIQLFLQNEQAEPAFAALEHTKSQVLLGHLAQREQLRWSGEDKRTQQLLEELNDLRAEHHWSYRQAHEPQDAGKQGVSKVNPEQALNRLSEIEKSIRHITEQLYLLNHNSTESSQTTLPDLRDIQSHLSDKEVLIEYYNDGDNLWAFTVQQEAIHVHELPTQLLEVEKLLDKLQLNIDRALRTPTTNEQTLYTLTSYLQRLAAKLYDTLIAPLDAVLQHAERLIVVPYGSLHYLPFHILFHNECYLIEQYEIVVLPAAGLLTRDTVQQEEGALVLTHDWDEKLPQTVVEAEIIERNFGAEVYRNETAKRAVLQRSPRQILHIAAHGEHRIDQPDFSYIQLADGYLYSDDVLQQDLSYELVTLSACETGRAQVAPGDELIGLGRGFLYAGAGALITSLWRVDDIATTTLMDLMYSALKQGHSKASAIRSAQLTVLQANHSIHPAYWGAFQLVGDARPLSKPSQQSEIKEYSSVRNELESNVQFLYAR